MSDDDEGGYGKPPKRARFKKGQSGNPAGRPKKPKTVEGLIKRQLSKQMEVRIGGKAKKILGIEAVIQAQFIKALKGDPRAFQFLFKSLQGREGSVSPTECPRCKSLDERWDSPEEKERMEGLTQIIRIVETRWRQLISAPWLEEELASYGVPEKLITQVIGPSRERILRALQQYEPEIARRPGGDAPERDEAYDKKRAEIAERLAKRGR